MKLIALIVFAFMLNSTGNHCQWEHIATIGNNDLKAVKFFNEHTGIVAGQGGIWRSTNGGVNWLQVLSGQNLNALSFPDNNIGYSVGDSGKIYKTVDSGLNWFLQNSSISQNLNGVAFVDISTGWTVGDAGKILRTLNGGGSWQTQTAQFQLKYNGVFMLNANTGYIYGSVSEEAWLYTGNAGMNWFYTLNAPGNTIQGGSSIPAIQSNVISVGSAGRIRKSTNNGLSWSSLSSNTSAKLNCIQFTDPSTAFIAGDFGTILKSTNIGSTWVTQTSSVSADLYSISCINSSTGWAVGNNGTVIRIGIPVGINNIGNDLPSQFKLYQNYPNPFNPETKVTFSVPQASNVDLSIYNILGEKIITLVKGIINAGDHIIYWNAEAIVSGVYFCKLTDAQKIISIKMLLIK